MGKKNESNIHVNILLGNFLTSNIREKNLIGRERERERDYLRRNDHLTTRRVFIRNN